MKKFVVQIREVHIQLVEIEAENYLDAIHRVENGEGDNLEGGSEYSHTLEPDFWYISGPDDKHPISCDDLLNPEENEDDESEDKDDEE
jgi:hypothetical protein